MNNHAEKWIRALRSGDYEQGTSTLHAYYGPDATRHGKERFCCLGVACDLYLNEVGDLDRSMPSGTIGSDTTVTYDDESSYLPLKVSNWLGLCSPDGRFGSEPQSLDNIFNPEHTLLQEANSLSELNDNGASFSEIASVIEAEGPSLFYEGGE